MRILAASFLALMVGCSSIEKHVTDQEFADVVRLGAKASVRLGVMEWKDGKDADQLAAIDAELAKTASLIRELVLPIFAGAETGTVLRGAVDLGLSQLMSRVSPDLLEILRVAINLAATRIELPENPAEKLSPRTQMAIRAFLEGVLAGME